MNSTKLPAIVFDLDGTLVNTAPDIHSAVNKMLLQSGEAELSLEKVTSFIGNGIPKLVERVMTEVKIPKNDEVYEDLIDQFTGFYLQEPAERSYLYPGVSSLLEILHKQGFSLAVCTNKPAGLAHIILHSLSIHHFFDTIIGGDSLNVKKPDPAPLLTTLKMLNVSKCIYVGDSEVDALTAVNAQQPFFLFSEGYRKSPAKEIPAVVRYNNFANLFSLIQKFLLEDVET